jgi:diguanylate cyclase (GGDEF)-like protein
MPYRRTLSSWLPDNYITRTYIVALGMIALLSLISHITLERVIAAHEGSGEIINVSGRQRMLSQKIAFDASLYVLKGDAAARDDLIAATGRLEQAHRQLLGNDPAVPLAAPLSEAVRAIYFRPPYLADEQVRRYLDYARIVANEADGPGTPAGTLAYDGLIALARGPLLPALEAVVVQHQRESEAQLAKLRVIQMLVLGVLLVTLAVEAVLVFRPMARRMRHYAAELLAMATVDPLTGALNRRAFMERSRVEIERARRHGRPLSLLMLDGDHFKQVNDAYGHAAGDEALRVLTRTVASLLRASDCVGRFGGEEFVVLAPETSMEGACQLAERIRAIMAGTLIAHGETEFHLTVSIGATEIGADEMDITPALARADSALYRAKEQGRNRVSSFMEAAATV